MRWVLMYEDPASFNLLPVPPGCRRGVTEDQSDKTTPLGSLPWWVPPAYEPRRQGGRESDSAASWIQLLWGSARTGVEALPAHGLTPQQRT